LSCTNPFDPFLEIIFAGIPPIVILLFSKLLLTTALAPITLLLPIIIGPNNLAPGPI